MRLLYAPFSRFARTFSSRLGRSLFTAIWSRIDAGEPPTPKTEDASLVKVLAAASIEAAVMAGAAALADRAAARAFQYLFGAWPGEKRKPSDEG